jgi:hypothetical protein
MAGVLSPAESYTMILGTNEIAYCDAALVIEDEEVFRVREEENGELLIDCDLRNHLGERIAKIVRNTPVFVDDGYEAKIRPNAPSEVIHKESGKIIARIARVGRRTISVTGPFFVKGCFVYATEDGLSIRPPGANIVRNRITGWGTAVKADKTSTRIGFSGSPPRK